MATFNFNGPNNVSGDQFIAARDFIGDPRASETALGVLAGLLRDIQRSTAEGQLALSAGNQASACVTEAMTALKAGQADAPGRAQALLARTRELIATATLIPALVDGVTTAIEAVRRLC
jgi:hypothetical protein